MKVRSDFVSNSSSSSFIISTPAPEGYHYAKIECRVDISELVEYSISTIADLKGYATSNWMSKEGEFWDGCEELYNKCLREIQVGRVIQVCSVSSGDNSIGEGIYREGIDCLMFPPEITLIDKGE